MRRKVIIHKHLFKNAGTTFDWILKKNFGEAFYDHRDDNPMRKDGFSYLIQFLKDNPQIKALSSHHIWFQLQKDEIIDLIPVYLIRHPIERIYSVYKFERIQDSDSLGAKMAKKMNFKEYVLWRMRDDVPATIRNFQTRYLSGTNQGDICDENSLGKAIEELLKNRFIGIVDRFDLSMSYFEKEFNNIEIHTNLIDYIPQNVLQDIQNINIKERVSIILNELGTIANLVIQENKYDLQIYEYATKLLNDRTKNNI